MVARITFGTKVCRDHERYHGRQREDGNRQQGPARLVSTLASVSE